MLFCYHTVPAAYLSLLLFPGAVLLPHCPSCLFIITVISRCCSATTLSQLLVYHHFSTWGLTVYPPLHSSLLQSQLYAVTSHEHHGISMHQQHICLHNSLFRLAWRKISKLCITGSFWGWVMDAPHKWPVMQRVFPDHHIYRNDGLMQNYVVITDISGDTLLYCNYPLNLEIQFLYVMGSLRLQNIVR